MKKKRVAQLLDRTGLRRLLAAVMPGSGIIVLNYHRIGDGDASNLDRGVWSATVEDFERHLAWLKRACDVIGPADIEAARARRGRHLLITFDDGYRDNHDFAYQALRAHGLPATFFITTGFIDQPRLPWWDEIAARVRGSPHRVLELPGWLDGPRTLASPREPLVRELLGLYKRQPLADTGRFMAELRAATGGPEPESGELWMNWDMLRDMAAHGMTIGGHTVNHIVLAGAPRQRQFEEIAGCAQRLREELGQTMEYFAYPVGARTSFDADSRACLAELGVRYAFSYYGGYTRVDRPFDPLDMQRVAVDPAVDMDIFRAMTDLPRWFCRTGS